MLQALILGVLVTTGAVRIWDIYLLALALGVNNAFDNPTRQAFVPEMVGKDLVTNAVPLNSTLFNAARIVGPGHRRRDDCDSRHRRHVLSECRQLHPGHHRPADDAAVGVLPG